MIIENVMKVMGMSGVFPPSHPPPVTAILKDFEG